MSGSDAYARQGMKPMTSTLGGLFAGSGASDEDLAYQRVSAGGKKAPASAPAPSGGSGGGGGGGGGGGAASGKAEFIFVTAVAGLFYLTKTGGYEPRGAGASIGCVVVGAGVAYNLMFYDAAKTTLLVAPVNAAVRCARARAPGAALPCAEEKIRL